MYLILKNKPYIYYIFCEGGIRKFGGKISLYHINSVLHFLIGINRMRKCMEKANVVCKLLPDILRRILKQKWYTFVLVHSETMQ